MARTASYVLDSVWKKVDVLHLTGHVLILLVLTRAKPAAPVYSRLRCPNHRSVDKGRERKKKLKFPLFYLVVKVKTLIVRLGVVWAKLSNYVMLPRNSLRLMSRHMDIMCRHFWNKVDTRTKKCRHFRNKVDTRKKKC